MKKLKKLLIIMLCLCLSTTYPVTAYAEGVEDSGTESNSSDSYEESDESTTAEEESEEETTYNISSKVMLADNWETPTATYGQQVSIVVPLVNMDKYDIYDVIITPELSTDTESFPFEIEKSSYTVKIDSLPGENSDPDVYNRRREVTYTFTTRDDVTNGYQKIAFDVLFTTADGTSDSATVEMYVKTVGAPGSGNADGTTSVPRVVVTGFETDPEEVKAGEDFNLTIHLQNTSQNTDISNMKIDLEAATEGTDENTTYEAFLPVEGSSTLFIESIGKGETTDVSIAMNAKSDLTTKPYVLDVKMEYEDEKYNQYTSDASVSIPVHQDPRFEVSEPEILPATIAVGSESNIMFSIYNTGKTKLYNVSVAFEGDSITGGDSFVGNIEAGETGTVDTMVTGANQTSDDGTIKAIISYENESGVKSTYEKTFTLVVTEEESDEDMEDFTDDEEYYEEESSFPWGILIVIILLIVAAVAAVIIIKKKKGKKAEDDLLNSIDDDSDDDMYLDDSDEVEDIYADTDEDIFPNNNDELNQNGLGDDEIQNTNDAPDNEDTLNVDNTKDDNTKDDNAKDNDINDVNTLDKEDDSPQEEGGDHENP